MRNLLRYLRKQKKDKAKTQRIHARKRALQRYNIDINRNDIEEIIKKINSGEAKFIEKQSLRVSIWFVEIKGKKVKVVYDKLRKTIASFLPIKERRTK